MLSDLDFDDHKAGSGASKASGSKANTIRNDPKTRVKAVIMDSSWKIMQIVKIPTKCAAPQRLYMSQL